MFLGLATQGPMHAGSVEGPYLVWVNLAPNDTAHADEQIKAFVNGEQRLCWPDGALLYMRERPPGITTDLVQRALEFRDSAALRRLQMLLRRPFGEVSGFDGVIAYSQRRGPTLIGLSTKGAVRAEPVRNAAGEAAWGATFCRVMPPISRLP